MEKRERASTQPPRVVQAKLDNLPPNAPGEEREMLNWFLKQGSYPKWRYAVRSVVDAEVNVEGDVSLRATNLSLSGNQVQDDDHFHLILSVGSEEHTVNTLRELTPPPLTFRPIPTLEELRQSFRKNLYFLADDDSFVIHQAILTGRPLLLCGPKGTGKTECAKQIALALGLNEDDPNHFGTLFCTPDVGLKESVYEWNDARRLLDLQLVNSLLQMFGSRLSRETIEDAYQNIAKESYSLRYLEVKRLLRHCVIPFRTVCLIDEVDKTYSEFDNVLLDILSKFSFEIPEYLGEPIGKPRNSDPFTKDSPLFILTSNESRELSSPLTSRCVQIWLKYLPERLEAQVIEAKVPGISFVDSAKIAQFFRKIRTNRDLRLRHPPSTREVLATAQALKLSNLDSTDYNLYRLNCHWVKNKLDFDAIYKIWQGK